MSKQKSQSGDLPVWLFFIHKPLNPLFINNSGQLKIVATMQRIKGLIIDNG
jgi:hypothetical protein